MKRKRIVVVGSSFAGFTAAMELSRQLGNRHEVTVLSKSRQLHFAPSLIRVPFGAEPITFDLQEPLEKAGVRFLDTDVIRLSLETRTVTSGKGELPYDYLLIATGSKPNYAAIPGLGPRGYTQSILTLVEAGRARVAFERFLEAPGPVVVGAAQAASSPAYLDEFAFHMGRELQRRGIADRAPLFYLSPAPSLERWRAEDPEAGRARQLFEQLGIRFVADARIRKVDPNEILLDDERRISFRYAVVVPPFLGVDAVRACERITDAAGFVRVDARCRTLACPQVFAAGAAISRQDLTPPACESPSTGRFAEETARIAAHNITAAIEGGRMMDLSVAGGAAVSHHEAGDTSGPTASLPAPQRQSWMIPGPEADWAQAALERYSTRRRTRGENGK